MLFYPVAHHLRACMQHPSRTGFTVVEVIVVVAIVATLLAILVPAIQHARESSRRLTCGARLGQLGLAFHRHHEAKGAFPPGWRDFPAGPNGKAGLAWGFAMLPFIEQETLWRSVKQEASAFAVENDSARQTLVPLYRCPSDFGQPLFDVQRPGGAAARTACARSNVAMTCTAAGVDRNGAFSAVSRLFPPLKMKDIADGASRTVLCGESATTKTDHRTWAEVWGIYVLPAEAPADFGGLSGPHGETFVAGRMNPSDGNWDTEPPFGHRDFDGFSSRHPNGVTFAFADGHVALLSGGLSFDIKLALESISGGEIAIGE